MPSGRIAIEPPRPLEPGEAFCTRCRAIKAAGEFRRNKTRRNGLAAWCSACLDPYTREYHKKGRYNAYYQRRKNHGSNLHHIPLGQKYGAIKNGTWVA